jgi:hypothetical protein
MATPWLADTSNRSQHRPPQSEVDFLSGARLPSKNYRRRHRIFAIRSMFCAVSLVVVRQSAGIKDIAKSLDTAWLVTGMTGSLQATVSLFMRGGKQ